MIERNRSTEINIHYSIGERLQRSPIVLTTMKATEQALARVFGVKINLREKGKVNFVTTEINEDSQVAVLDKKEQSSAQYLLSANFFRQLLKDPDMLENRERMSAGSLNLFRTLAKLALEEQVQPIDFEENPRILAYFLRKLAEQYPESQVENVASTHVMIIGKGSQIELTTGHETFIFSRSTHLGVITLLIDHLEGDFMDIMSRKTAWFTPPQSWSAHWQKETSPYLEETLNTIKKVLDDKGISNRKDLFAIFVSSQLAASTANSLLGQIYVEEEEVRKLETDESEGVEDELELAMTAAAARAAESFDGNYRIERQKKRSKVRNRRAPKKMD